jgi:hypothetical protein
MKKKGKILLILSSVLLFLLLSFIGLFVYEYIRISPKDVYFTNVTSGSVTVSWSTKNRIPMSVMVREGGRGIPIAILGGTEKFFDTRDVKYAELVAVQETSDNVVGDNDLTVSINDFQTEVEVTQRGEYYTHHVTVTGLNPETEYSFLVGDRYIFREISDSNGNTTAKTLVVPEEIRSPVPAYGSVKDAENQENTPIDNLTPITDGVVYFNYWDEVTNERSAVYSSSFNSDGNWYMDVSNAVGEDGKHFISRFEDTVTNLYVELTIDAGPLGTWKKVLPFNDTSPTDVIVLNDPLMIQDAKLGIERLDSMLQDELVKGVEAGACLFMEYCGPCYDGVLTNRCSCSKEALEVRGCSSESKKSLEDVRADANKRAAGSSNGSSDNEGGITCSGGGVENSYVLFGTACKKCVPSSSGQYGVWETQEGSTYCKDHSIADGHVAAPDEDNEGIIDYELGSKVEGGICSRNGRKGIWINLKNMPIDRCPDGNCSSLGSGLYCEINPSNITESQNYKRSYTDTGTGGDFDRIAANIKYYIEDGKCLPVNISVVDEDSLPAGTFSEISLCERALDAIETYFYISGDECKQINATSLVTTDVGRVYQTEDLCRSAIAGQVTYYYVSGSKCVDITALEISIGGVIPMLYGSASECSRHIDYNEASTSQSPIYTDEWCWKGASRGAYRILPDGTLQRCRNNGVWKDDPVSTGSKRCMDLYELGLDSGAHCNNKRDFCSISIEGEYVDYYCDGNRWVDWITYKEDHPQDVIPAGNAQVIGYGEKCLFGGCICPDQTRVSYEQNCPYQVQVESTNCNYENKGKVCNNDGSTCIIAPANQSAIVKDTIKEAKSYYLGGGKGRVCVREDNNCYQKIDRRNDLVPVNLGIWLYICESGIHSEKNNVRFDSLSYSTEVLAESDVNSSQEYIIDPKTGFIKGLSNGVYMFEYDGQYYSFEVKDYNSDSVLIFVDKNNNQEYDSDIDLKVSDIGTKVNIIPITQEYQYQIHTGLNFISFPYLIYGEEYRTAASLLHKLNEIYNDTFYSISKFDGRWKIVGQNTDMYDNNDFQLLPGEGYMIKSKEDIDISIVGQPIQFETETDQAPINLNQGWNLIGLYGTNIKTYTAKSLIEDINTDDFIADNVTKWAADKQLYEGLQISDGEEYGFDFPLNKLESYFVRITQGSGNWQPSLGGNN